MKKGYDNKRITAYLLGDLPEAEAESFDELSFTDDDFADELNAAEKDLVDAYVHGELRGATLEQFKSYYLASPVRREKVQFAQSFQEFAKKNAASKPIAITESETKQSSAGFFSNIFKNLRLSLQWGFAIAALALMIFGGWLFLENSRLRFEMNEAQAKRDELLKRESEFQQRERQLRNEIAKQQTDNSATETEFAKIREEREKLEQELKNLQQQQQISERKRQNEQRAATKKQPVFSLNRQSIAATFLLTPSMRGNNQLQTISIPANTDAAVVRLELESDDYPIYRVALKNLSDSRILWQSGKIKSKSNGANPILSINFPASLLKSQIYSLEVSGISADGSAEIISDYSFKVVR